mmetsp:Transcript_8259/g.16735  ORF Transcript_8259/g.16735 Transcript_8259/m.16735 type:complete len:107 (+) Transcript_8259:437-757(+)
MEVDNKLVNAVTLKIEREDHTIGNLLRMQLLRDPDVIYAGYRHPHPLTHHILLRVQTKAGLDSDSPVKAITTAMQDLRSELSLLDERFKQALRARQGQEGAPFGFQ